MHDGAPVVGLINADGCVFQAAGGGVASRLFIDNFISAALNERQRKSRIGGFFSAVY
jgi:hypothetical protein